MFVSSVELLLCVGTFHRHNVFYTVQTVYSFYTNTTTNPTYHRKLSAFLHFQKNITWHDL